MNRITPSEASDHLEKAAKAFGYDPAGSASIEILRIFLREQRSQHAGESDKTAQQIVVEWLTSDFDIQITPEGGQALTKAIASALAAARQHAAVPEGHVMQPDGTTRAVQTTADGKLAFPHIDLCWHPERDDSGDVDVTSDEIVGSFTTAFNDGSHSVQEYPIGECYSTRKAALAAKGDKEPGA